MVPNRSEITYVPISVSKIHVFARASQKVIEHLFPNCIDVRLIFI